MSHKLTGAQQFRQRLVCATLSGSSIRIDDIRSNDSNPGLRDYEASLLRLIERISNGCIVEINETGTKLRYKPGVIVGGRNLIHNCGSSRAIGYFLEPLILLSLFGKKPLSITLKGTTNDDVDVCVDRWRSVTLPLLHHFGVPKEGLELKVLRRAARPRPGAADEASEAKGDGGTGEVLLTVPNLTTSLTAVHLTEEGMVKRVRGIAYSMRVPPQVCNRMVDSARGLLNKLLPDVYIFTDHFKKHQSADTPGYGISLWAETTSGCTVGTECAPAGGVSSLDEAGGSGAGEGSGELRLPEDVGLRAAQQLLEEIKAGGVVDTSHQSLTCLLCAICPEDVSKVRVGRLSPQCILTLRTIKEILGVQFNIQPDASTGTVLLSCIGSGWKNLHRKLQ